MESRRCASNVSPSHIAMMSILNIQFITFYRYFINTVIVFTSYFRLILSTCLKIHSLKLTNTQSVSIVANFHDQAFKVKNYLYNSVSTRQTSIENMHKGSKDLVQHIITCQSCVIESIVQTNVCNCNSLQCFSDFSNSELNNLIETPHFYNRKSPKDKKMTVSVPIENPEHNEYEVTTGSSMGHWYYADGTMLANSWQTGEGPGPSVPDVPPDSGLEAAFEISSEDENDSDHTSVSEEEDDSDFEIEFQQGIDFNLQSEADEESDFDLQSETDEENDFDLQSEIGEQSDFDIQSETDEEFHCESDEESDFEIEFEEENASDCEPKSDETMGSDPKINFDDETDSCNHQISSNTPSARPNIICSLFISQNDNEETDEEDWDETDSRVENRLDEVQNVNIFNETSSNDVENECDADDDQCDGADNMVDNGSSRTRSFADVMDANYRWDFDYNEWRNKNLDYFRTPKVRFPEEVVTGVREIPAECRVNTELIDIFRFRMKIKSAELILGPILKPCHRLKIWSKINGDF